MLTVKTMVEGKCSWCQKETEVLPAEFPDGLKGQFCRNDFWEAAKSRSAIPKKNGKKTEPVK